MSLEDPFFVVKDEVLKALLKTRQLFERWRGIEEGRELLRSVDEQEWNLTELRNALRSIEWDLEDLEDTIQIVEKNPSKFRIDATELSVRKSFIVQTKAEVTQMKLRTDRKLNDESTMDQVELDSPTQIGRGQGSKYARLPHATDLDSPSHVSSSSSAHQLLQEQRRLQDDQDAHLDLMTHSVENIGNMSRQIGNELDEQAVMLDEFGAEIENAESKLDATMRKMAKVLHMSNDKRQWMAIGALSSATLVVLLLIFAL